MDVESVINVLKSDFLTQGGVTPKFEKVVASKVGAKHAFAVNSATSALHIACMALGLGPGDWLWTSVVTFVASANCGLYCGAEVDFVDIDPKTYNLCPQALETKLVKAERLGKLPKVLVAVHMCGQSCDMQAIHLLSQRYGFKIIEDASHAIGGKYLGRNIGNCRFSEITIFSFHPVKIVTTGEGGMALTNDDALAEKMNLHRSHGVTRDPGLMTKEVDGPWYYQQIEIGYNYRMTEIQAALGMSQMKRLDEFVKRRHQLAEYYDSALKEAHCRTPWRDPNCLSAFHLYVIRLCLNKFSKTHREVFEELISNGVLVNLHYIPLHLQPFFEKMGFKRGDFPQAEAYYAEAVSIPLFPAMKFSDQEKVVNTIQRVISA